MAQEARGLGRTCHRQGPGSLPAPGYAQAFAELVTLKCLLNCGDMCDRDTFPSSGWTSTETSLCGEGRSVAARSRPPHTPALHYIPSSSSHTIRTQPRTRTGTLHTRLRGAQVAVFICYVDRIIEPRNTNSSHTHTWQSEDAPCRRCSSIYRAARSESMIVKADMRAGSSALGAHCGAYLLLFL